MSLTTGSEVSSAFSPSVAKALSDLCAAGDPVKLIQTILDPIPAGYPNAWSTKSLKNAGLFQAFDEVNKKIDSSKGVTGAADDQTLDKLKTDLASAFKVATDLVKVLDVKAALANSASVPLPDGFTEILAGQMQEFSAQYPDIAAVVRDATARTFFEQAVHDVQLQLGLSTTARVNPPQGTPDSDLNSSNMPKVDTTLMSPQEFALQQLVKPFSMANGEHTNISSFAEQNAGSIINAKNSQIPEETFKEEKGLIFLLKGCIDLPLPEVATGTFKKLSDVLAHLKEDTHTGAAEEIREILLDLYRVGSFLREIAGPDFIQNPTGGFIGRLKDLLPASLVRDDAVLPTDKTYNVDVPNAFRSASYVYGCKLANYFDLSFKIVMKLGEIDVDNAIVKATGLKPRLAAQLPGMYNQMKLNFEVLKHQIDEHYVNPRSDQVQVWSSHATGYGLKEIAVSLHAPTVTESGASFSRLAQQLMPIAEQQSNYISQHVKNDVALCEKTRKENLTKTDEGIAKNRVAAIKAGFFVGLGIVAAKAIPYFPMLGWKTLNGAFFMTTLYQASAAALALFAIPKLFKYLEDAKKIEWSKQIKMLAEKDKFVERVGELPNFKEMNSVGKLATTITVGGLIYGGLKIVTDSFEVFSKLFHKGVTASGSGFLDKLYNFSTSSLPWAIAIAAGGAVLGRFFGYLKFRKDGAAKVNELAKSLN